MIYIAAHKKFDDPGMENYCPLQVGAEGKNDLGYLLDNTEDNISIKNPNFCELTGVYWIWKNTSDDYKGLVHYRRYFGKSNLSSNPDDIYTYEEMKNMLKDADIVLPYVEYFKQNAKDEILIYCCTPEIFEQLECVVKEKYPEYGQAFDDYFKQNQSTLFNMMFCRGDLFDKYCEWLFDILFELEKHVDLSVLNDYQKRLYGFLSERLLNVWVLHNELTVKNVSVINIEMPIVEKIQLIRRRLTNRIRYNITYK